MSEELKIAVQDEYIHRVTNTVEFLAGSNVLRRFLRERRVSLSCSVRVKKGLSYTAYTRRGANA